MALDRRSVGRLSGMDALRNRPMAQGRSRRRKARERRVHVDLARIEEGEHRVRPERDETIAARRLECDPAVPTCIACARA